MDYQLKRTRADLATEKILRLAHVDPDSHQDESLHVIRNMMDKAGLCDDKKMVLVRRPERPDIRHYREDLTVSYEQDDRFALDLCAEYDLKMKFLKKFIQTDGHICPFTNRIYLPPGDQNFLRHMLEEHPKSFWVTDNFHLIPSAQ